MRRIPSALALYLSLSTLSRNAHASRENMDSSSEPLDNARDQGRGLRTKVSKNLTFHGFILDKGKGKGKGKGYKKSKSQKGRKSKSQKGRPSVGCGESSGSRSKGKGKGYASHSYSTSGKESFSYDGKGSRSGSLRSQSPSFSSQRSQEPSCSPAPSIYVDESSSYPSPSPSTTNTVNTEPSHFPSVEPSESAKPSEALSTFPTILFDLQICESYSREWLFDLHETCDSTFEVCECRDAQTKIDSGQIDCSQDICPDNCSTCTVCLESVISCIPSTRIQLGYELPPFDLIQELASIEETEETDFFNLDHCDTYQNQWLKDLGNSCVEEDSSARNCECYDAHRRIESGQIETSSFCPDDCEVCKFCLDIVLGFYD